MRAHTVAGEADSRLELALRGGLWAPDYAPAGAQLDAPRAAASAVDGLLVVDKPLGITSHDVVAKVRRLAATRKVGHAGTLDPNASGVLVLGLGRGTKLLQFAQAASKTYVARVVLGVETTTEDAAGEVSARYEVAGAYALEAALSQFRGQIMQVPSSVSAIKVGGKKALLRVRAGEELELPARPVTIYRLELVGPLVFTERYGQRVGVFDLLVSCSSGTYVRALARDLGRALGCGAHLLNLRRVEACGYTVGEQVWDLETLAARVEAGSGLPVTRFAEAASQLFAGRTVYVDAAQALALSLGQKIAFSELLSRAGMADTTGDFAFALRGESGLARAYFAAHPQLCSSRANPDLVLGIYRFEEGKWQTRVVFCADLRPYVQMIERAEG